MSHFFKKLRFPGTWPVFKRDDRLLLIILAIIVGNCSGIAALALNYSLGWFYETLIDFQNRWWVFLLPAAGAALSCFFLRSIVKEETGHGVPEVIYNVSRHGGFMRLRSSFSQLVASCLTIGSGGSAGPEAPVVISGASIGSNIARALSLNDRQRITLVGCGAAGAIASIFNAPVAGMVFSIEVILGEWKSLHIIPIAIAAVAGTEISHLLKGNQILFSHHQFVLHLSDIIACVGFALVTAGASVALARTLRGMSSVASRVMLPPWAKAAIGGLAVGGLGLVSPMVLGEGYHFISNAINGDFKIGLWVAVVAALAKILATAMTLGWGGAGGIFAPSLVIGSFVGLAYHRLMMWIWPSFLGVGEGCFALIGMAGLISGILQAPLTGIFLIVGITGSYDVILPLIIVSSLSTALCRYAESSSYYLKELVEKGQLLRPGTDARVLTDLTIPELLEKDCVTVPSNMRLREFINIVSTSRRNYFPVEDPDDGRFVGMIHLDDIRPYLFNTALYDMVMLEQIMNRNVLTVGPEEELNRVLEKMDVYRLFSIPVISEGRFVGMISKATLLDQYRRELIVQTAE
jgi:chloride channel protein, CIC family